MSVITPGPVGSVSLVDRVKAILLSPKTEWERIDTEPATTQGLFTGYAMILAAVPAVAQVIGSFFPICVLGVCVHRNPIFAIVGGVVFYVLSLVGVFVISLIANELAPSFGGQKDSVQAQKLVIYSWTAAWLAGIFSIIPMLGILGIVGLYSFYLLYLGAAPIMKVPADKAIGYVAVTIIVGIVVYAVVGMIVGSVMAMGMIGAGMGMGGLNISANSPAALTGTMHVGGASVDLGKLQAASQQMQAAANQLQAQQNGQPAPAGSVKAVAPEMLKSLLPAALPAGYARGEVEASSAGVAGVGGSSAQGTYKRGDQQITLQVTDMAAMGALAALGGVVDAQSEKQTATGYEKMGKIDGRMTNEEFDNQSKVGKYSVIVANRFMVEADGEGADMGDLKNAVNSVGFGRLEGLAQQG